MKFPVSIILMALMAFGMCLYLPWWSIAVSCFVVSLLIPMHPWDSFLAGFAAIALLWAGLSFYISYQNDHILAEKISVLLLKSENPYLAIAVTALLGGMVGGLSSLTASWLRMRRKEKA